MGRRFLIGLLGMAGVGLTSLAFLANLFGLDRNNNWGPGRTIVAIVGISFLLTALLIFTWPFWMNLLKKVKDLWKRLIVAFLRLSLVQKSLHSIQNRLGIWHAALTRLPAVRWYMRRVKPRVLLIFSRLRGSRPVRYFCDSQDRMAALAAAILGTLIIVIYVWYVSVGRWTSWPKTNTYYFQLAEAFRHGQTNLLVKTDPKLLRLEDPYDLQNRDNVAYVWDAAFYNGKFYLYWGPVPALILVATHFFYPGEIGDQVLVFGFVCGTFIFTSLLLLQIRKRLFPGFRWPYVVPAILMAGLANPLPWLLNRPAVYEAAIAGGQCFLFAGLFWGFLGIERQPFSSWKLVLAGACFVMASASRLTLLPAAFFLIFMTAWYILQPANQYRSGRLLPVTGLVLPFIAGLVGLGWYNYIRFDSWLDFGSSYMLTWINVHAIGNGVFSWSNLAYNLHNYLLNPFRTMSIFPFVKPEWGGHFIFFVIRGSQYSNSEQVSGMIPTIPYILLAVMPVMFLLWRFWEPLKQVLKGQFRVRIWEGDGLLGWTIFTVSIACLLAFGPVLLYMTSSMRYLGDGVPLLVLLSTIGFWLGARLLAKTPASRSWFIALVVLLTVYSVIISLLLAVTGYDARFEKLNPALFDQLTRMLMP